MENFPLSAWPQLKARTLSCFDSGGEGPWARMLETYYQKLGLPTEGMRRLSWRPPVLFGPLLQLRAEMSQTNTSKRYQSNSNAQIDSIQLEILPWL